MPPPTDAILDSYRPHLFGLAYRLLGTLADAEDAVQDAYLRFEQSDKEAIDNPKAWLTTVVTNRCLDVLRAARRKRETYIGEWLPEPVATDASGMPELLAERADGLSLAFLALIERLTPLERAAYLLHDIFDYRHDEIAKILERSETACRQLVSRARKHIRDGRPRLCRDAPPPDAEVVTRFVTALQAGDADSAMAALSEQAVLTADGGGKAAAALNPIRGANKITRFFLGVAGKLPYGVVWAPRQVNGQPGFVGRYPDGRAYAVLAFHVDGGKIVAIQSILNADKLTGFPAVSASAGADDSAGRSS